MRAWGIVIYEDRFFCLAAPVQNQSVFLKVLAKTTSDRSSNSFATSITDILVVIRYWIFFVRDSSGLTWKLTVCYSR